MPDDPAPIPSGFNDPPPADPTPTPVDSNSTETPPADQPADPQKPVDAPADEQPADPPPFDVEAYLKGVTVDEGQDYTFDADLLKEVAPVANELGIAPEALGKLANLLGKREAAQLAAEKTRLEEIATAREANVKQMDEAVAKLKADNPQMAKRVQAALNLPFLKDSTFMKALEETELSHDPVLWQLLERVGRTLGNDPGAGRNAPPKSHAAASLAEILSGGQYK